MRTNLKSCALSLTLGAAILGAAVASAQAQEVHRVVTTINKDDKSAALFDAQVPLQKGGGGEAFATLWDAEGAGRLFVGRRPLRATKIVLTTERRQLPAGRRVSAG